MDTSSDNANQSADAKYLVGGDLLTPKEIEGSKESAECKLDEGELVVPEGGDKVELDGVSGKEERPDGKEPDKEEALTSVGEPKDEEVLHVSEIPCNQNGTETEEVVAPEGRAKRVRKSVEQWEPEGSKKRKSLEELQINIPDGRGTALGDIPFLKEAISHNKDSELLALAHRFVFGTKGRMHIPKGHKETETLRSHLFKFCGYLPADGGEFTKEKLEKIESELEEKFTERAGKMPKDTLIDICNFFCLSVTSSSSKETLMQRILDFLGCPDASLLKKPVEKKPKGKGSAQKGKRNSKGGKKGKPQDAGEDEAMTETDSENEGKESKRSASKNAAQKDNSEGLNSMPGDEEIKKWIKAYVACFDIKKATTNHAVSIAQDKFGVDFSDKKELFKELLTEEVTCHLKGED